MALASSPSPPTPKLAVHGGDVGLDEFAKHPNARLLWQTAQGRITWGFDIALWSSHDGQDTLFNQFAQEARAGKGPWNLYYRVTMPDATELGLVEVINRTQGARFTPAQFLADCQARAGSDDSYQQSYLCNPCGSSAATIVDWSAIERCRADYSIERLHLESGDITRLFGQPGPGTQSSRESQIHDFLRSSFPALLETSRFATRRSTRQRSNASSSPFRLGFDVAASGRGDLAAIYIDQLNGSELWLRALLTARTEDWHFLPCSFSWPKSLSSRPPATSPVSAAKFAGRPRANSPLAFPRSISPPKNMTSASPS